MTRRRIDVRLGANSVPVGQLIYEAEAGRETSSFSYDASWLENPNAFALAPGLPLQESPHFGRKHGNTSALPGPISDGAPDSWGRAIIKAQLGGRVESELTYLLEADDALRVGALRYYDVEVPDGPALAPSGRHGRVPIPRLMDIEDLATQARAFEMDPERFRENRSRMLYAGLLNAAGTLGGARPKVNAIDDSGTLWIVKLAKFDDSYAIARAEVLALRLAARVGLRACEARLLPTSQRFPVSLIRRFDRVNRGNGDQARIPFISAQSFMSLEGADPGNYVDLAGRMLAHCENPKAEIRELFGRVMFSILINNTDDHLRNHGFLAARGGKWRLSPTFDVNPTPDGSTLKTAISDSHGNEPEIDALIEVAPYFEVEEDEARQIALKMATIISGEWRQIGAQLGMTSHDIRSVAPALEGEQIQKALAFGKTSVPAKMGS